MNTTITAAATQSNGKSNLLEIVQRPAPIASDGRTLLRVSRAGINFVDVYQARGRYPVPPGTVLGFEAVGVAPDGTRYAVIDHLGAYAQTISVPNDKLILVPNDISDDYAMLLFQGVTAEFLTHSVHPLRAGEVVLVYAAAGGVGWMLMQVAKHAGTRPIGIVSTEAKARPLRERGYEVLVGDGSNFSLVRDLIPDGVDVAFDPNGKESWELTLASVKSRGHVVVFGAAGSQHDPIPVSLLRDRGSLTLTFASIFDHLADPVERQARAARVFSWLRGGTVVPQPFHSFPLDRVNDALLFIESRKSTGKLLLIP